jgi:hypothetical protein
MNEKGKDNEKGLKPPLVRCIVVLLLLMVFVLLATPAAAGSVKVWVNAPEYVAEWDTFVATHKTEEIPAEWIDAEVKIVKGEPEPMSTPPVNRVHNLNTSENFSSIQAAIDDPNTKEGHVI